MSLQIAEVIQPRGLDREQAARYVGSLQLLLDYRAAGWITPFVQGPRLTRYDRHDLDRCIERHKIEEPVAKSGRKLETKPRRTYGAGGDE